MRFLIPVLLLAVAAGAQVRKSVTVELIEVPVYVTVDGKPVRNLSCEALPKQIAFDESSRVATGWVTLREIFQLPPGTYAAKALLRIAGTNVLGFARNDFTIGE